MSNKLFTGSPFSFAGKTVGLKQDGAPAAIESKSRNSASGGELMLPSL